MRPPLRTAAVTLCLLGAALPVCASDTLFGPPPTAAAVAPLATRTDAAVQGETVRLARQCGVASPGRHAVGRFGGFAPPPEPVSPPLASSLFCPPTGPSEPASGAKGEGGSQAKKRDEESAIPDPEHHPHYIDPRACETACATGDFTSDAFYAPYNACDELGVYNDKHEVKPQRPLIEWGQPFYGPGPTPIASEAFGPTNLLIPKFYVYGDYRAGLAQNDLVNQEQTVLAHRLNLELDYWITSTERVHAFIGPFQKDARFMRVTDGRYLEELDFFQAETDTLFFEGDLGQILGGLEHRYATFDLPITFGLVPLLFQNGTWMQDAIVGGAVTIPARNSPALDWSNFDITFFGGVDRISSGAFGFDEDAAALLGATTFIESRGGYLELGYAFVDDQEGGGRSYHNLAASYTRRYANWVSNSVRLIVNAGQNTHGAPQTADGALVLIENTFLTDNPYNVLPYVNFFAGFDRPQPLARAGVFGGVLFNTGILFQSDALTGYPTLDATGNNTFGAAVGVDLLSPEFDQQLIVEAGALKTRGRRVDRTAPGDQVGVGVRWQKKLTTAHLIRADAMVGLLDNSDNVSGARVEYRWKF